MIQDIDKLYGKEWVRKRHGPHVKARDYIDVMVRSIVRDLACVSVLDLGCGACNFANAFSMYGCEVVAIDGSSYAKETARSDIEFIQWDLTVPICYHKRQFDLIFCVEVIEHIDVQYEHVVLDSIVKHAGNWIVFTAAPPGQDGIGHINCKPKEYWYRKFESLGFDYVDSDALVSEWRKKGVRYWYVDNLLILKRRNSD